MGDTQMTEKEKPKEEKEIDEALRESFPASDPPSWMGNAARPGEPDHEDEENPDKADES